MTLRQQARPLLIWIALQLHTPDGSANSKTNLETTWSGVHTEPEIPVSVTVGNATELRCRNETSEGSVMWWQTPFGSFGPRYQLSNKDPFKMISGNLRMPKVTVSHAGLYWCHLEDRRGITVIPYRVDVLGARTRAAREAVKPAIHYSDADLVAAVTSSVLVTFIGAFTLGALSQPFVIKCLQRVRSRFGPNKRNPRDTTRVSQVRTVVFRRNSNSKEDTVHFVPESSAAFKASSNTKTDQDESGLESNSYINTTTLDQLARDELEQTKGAEGGNPTSGHTRRKRVSRVIKLYNYDEDGNRYGHVKEPEDNPTPRQRVMSLTRLQSIMNEAETPDFSSSGDTTGPDDAHSA